MSQTNATIVVVDDDPDIVECLVDYLHGMGLDAVSCRVGPQVAACIAQHTPSLVILDVDLGDITGVDVLHAMRADPMTCAVPVIFFTGNVDTAGSPVFRQVVKIDVRSRHDRDTENHN